MEKILIMAEFGLKGNTKFSGRDREVPRLSKEESVRILRNNFKIRKVNLENRINTCTRNLQLQLLMREYEILIKEEERFLNRLKRKGGE